VACSAAVGFVGLMRRWPNASTVGR